MAWDFSTDPAWAEQLAWVDDFVRSECEPIDLIVKESHDLTIRSARHSFRRCRKSSRSAACGPPTSARTWVVPATGR